MSEDNAFSRILSRLGDSDSAITEKTASAPVDASTEARLLAQVRAVSDATVKTAATHTPATDLQAMAKQAQAAEAQQLSQQAHFMGAAVADGFMERFASYDAALEAQGVKIASAPYAASNDQMKLAAEAGYTQAVADLEKHADDEFNRGYQEQLALVHKTASEVHYAGQMVAHNLVEHARNGQ